MTEADLLRALDRGIVLPYLPIIDVSSLPKR